MRRLAIVSGARALPLSFAAFTPTAAGTFCLCSSATSAASADASAASTATAASASAAGRPPPQPSSSAPSPAVQPYKSTHKGSGARAMPRPAAPAGGALLGRRSSCAEDAGPVAARALTPLQRRQLLYRNKAAFVLTPQALRRVKFLLAQYATAHPPADGSDDSTAAAAGAAKQPVGIHIGVRRRGCSGYSYTVNYQFPSAATERHAEQRRRQERGEPPQPAAPGEDVVVEQDGVMVVVEADALFYVIGTEMDYVVRNVEEKFTFKNPNQKFSCGCEESFMPFDEDDLDD